MKILLIRSSAIGDIVCMYSAIKKLKKKYPDSTMDILSRSTNSNIIKWFSDIDNHISFDDKIVETNVNHAKKGKHLKVKIFIKFIKKYRSKYDYIYVFQNSIKALVLAKLLKPRIALYGYRNGLISSFISRNLINIDANEKEYKKHLKLIKSNDLNFIKGFKPKNNSMSIELKNLVKNLNSKKIILINPYAKWNSRSLINSQLITLISEIHNIDRTFKILLIGLKDRFENINRLKNEYGLKIINLLGKTTINDIYFLIKASSIFITVDTAPMHIAAHLDTKVHAIFGPTSSTRAGYKENKNYEVVCEKNKKIELSNNMECIKKHNMKKIAKTIMKDVN